MNYDDVIMSLVTIYLYALTGDEVKECESFDLSLALMIIIIMVMVITLPPH